MRRYERPDFLPFSFMWTKDDLIRLAAFIDGEGCITILKQKSTNIIGAKFQLVIYVVNTDPKLPEWCQSVFGGNLLLKRMDRYSPNNRVQHMWQVSGRKASEILEACLPYFLLKYEQAKIAIDFQSISKFNEKRPTKEELEKKLESYNKLSNLKWVDHGKRD